MRNTKLGLLIASCLVLTLAATGCDMCSKKKEEEKKTEKKEGDK